MALLTKAPRGTADLLPSESHKIQYIEQTVMDVATAFGFHEIRVPVFEHAELFNRSVGETTDVVQKEMYTFEDNGGRSLSLRPEGTAGVVRAFLEHGLFNEPLPQKLSYLVSCYRYEKPQAGRYREFHQFGVECIGAASPAADAEIISLANTVFEAIGLRDISLEINSIGCPSCRKEYHKALKEYFTSKESELCGTCRDRLERNPMRILDCKSPICKEIAREAPTVLDYLCKDCQEHFDAVKSYLEAMEIPFSVNPRIVRGLDYYTRTVFEFVSSSIGAQGTVCGGGRYDGLVGELGGSPLPACGFGMGIERLRLVMENQGIDFPEAQRCNLYIVSTDRESSLEAARIASELRSNGICCEYDLCGRSVKAQMKHAGKLGADYTMVLGTDELSSRSVVVKNMQNGTTQELSLEDFSIAFLRMNIDQIVGDFSLDAPIEI